MRYGIAIIALILGPAVAAALQEESKAKREHVILTAADVKWGEAPPILPPGAKASLLDGDPKKEGVFILRLQLPSGWTLPPHFHPVDERVTVISGTFQLGLGDTFDETKMRDLPAGSFFSLPPKTHHFAKTRGETVIQINTVGPWALTYLNQDDDPRNKKK